MEQVDIGAPVSIILILQQTFKSGSEWYFIFVVCLIRFLNFN
jgi:hypothetical protein